MTRINTNVSSLNAQKSLARSNAQLQEALTRLSTGLRINAGKDDPAGLIGSEILRTDIVSTNKAISNSQRANQMLATADSALGQVSSLLNDIRALVGEAANKGALSDAQIAANQLQIDSSLEAIDRISQTTQFQGRRLLDGTLDFVTEGVSNTQVTDLAINKANFGTLSEIDVKVDVVAQATQAELDYAANTVTDANGVVLEIGGTMGFQAFNFAYNTSVVDLASAVNLVSDALGVTAEVQQVLATAAAKGSMAASSVGADNDVGIEAVNAGQANGDIAVRWTNTGATSRSITYSAAANGTDRLVVDLATSAWQAAAGTHATGGNGVTLTAKIAGSEYDNVHVVIDDLVATSEWAYYDAANKKVHVGLVSGANNAAALLAAINSATHPSVSSLFTASAVVGTTLATGEMTHTPTATGQDGAVIAATETATSIRAAINACGDANTYVLASGTGAGVVTAFQEYALYGTANIGRSTDTNDRLQFLGSTNSRDLPIRFVTDGASQSLSITADPLYGSTGKSMAVFQDTNDDGSFKVEAKESGTAWDGVRVQIKDSAGLANDYVTWNAQTKVITVAVDLGDANGNSARAVDLINSDPIVGKYFSASLFGTSGANIDSAADTYSRYSTGGQAYSGITVRLATDANGAATTTAAQLVSYIESGPNPFTDLGISATNAQGSNGAGRLAATTSAIQWHTVGETMTNDFAQATTYNQHGSDAQLRIKARVAGSAYQNVRVVFTDVGAGNPNTFAYDTTTKTLTIGIDDGADTAADLIAAYTANGSASSAVYPLFDIQAIGTTPATLLSTADGARLGAGDNGVDGYVKGVRNTGNSYGAALLGNVDVGDVIGADGVKFKAVDYGLAAFVSIKSLSGTFTVTDTSGNAKERAYGADVNARINGIQAVGKGLQASINTATLDMALTLSSNTSYVTAGITINFTIKSGGAQFQIGPEVVSNQQTRLGLTSMSTATLGTSAGRLYQLRSGGDADLNTNVNLAASIVEGVVSQATTFRGRIGAFQKTTLDTNIKALTDTVETLTDAESSIRDADFAAETAAMTRAQILVQSGLSVLTIANNNPQNVLALLRG